MDQDGNPLSSAIAARKLVDRLVAAAWPPAAMAAGLRNLTTDYR